MGPIANRCGSAGGQASCNSLKCLASGKEHQIYFTTIATSDGLAIVVIILMLSHGALSRSESPLSTADPIPKKEEWAIINKYKAMEFERMKQQ